MPPQQGQTQRPGQAVLSLALPQEHTCSVLTTQTWSISIYVSGDEEEIGLISILLVLLIHWSNLFGW